MAFKRSAVRSRSAPQDMNFSVYALYSKRLHTIYIGQSQDVNDRANVPNKGYSKYTSRTNDWIIVYTETCSSRGDALKREKQLKTAGGRKFIWDIVKNKFSEVSGPS